LTTIYEDILADIEGICLFKEPVDTKSNYWLQVILLEEQSNRDEVLSFLNGRGVMSRPIWTPMHEIEMYKECPRMDLFITKQLKQCVINIPSTPTSEG